MTAMITEAQAAWQRIQDRTSATFEDWLIIGRALIAARQECMAQAGVNKPYGPAYQKLTRAWLDANDLSGIDSQERRGAIHIVEHQAEIEAWRASLTAKQRRRCNHPNSVLNHWRRGTTPKKSGPAPGKLKIERHASYPVFWPQTMVRRAAEALREHRQNNDLFVVARAVLEAAVPHQIDLADLIAPAAPKPKPKPVSSQPAAAVALHAPA